MKNKKKKSIKPYNTKCPYCDDPWAYKGFNTIECPSYHCKYYTQTQKDLVEQYNKELANELDEELQQYLAADNERGTNDPYDYSGYYSSMSCNTDATEPDDLKTPVIPSNKTPTLPYFPSTGNNSGTGTNGCSNNSYDDLDNDPFNDHHHDLGID